MSPPRDIFVNQFLRLVEVAAEFGDVRRKYFIVEYPTRVGAVVVRGDEVLLVRQYRFLAGAETWEIPGGSVDAGESPEEAIARECREEAGIICDTVEPMFDYQAGLDTAASQVRLFRVGSFEPAPAAGSAETTGRAWVRLPECIERIRRGDIRDLMTMVALTFFTHPGLALQSRDERT